MSTLKREQVAAALAEILRAALYEGQEARIPGLGTFGVHHETSQIDEREDGTIEMHPPRDVIVFSPEE